MQKGLLSNMCLCQVCLWSKAVSRSTMDLNRTQESLNVTIHLKVVAHGKRLGEENSEGRRSSQRRPSDACVHRLNTRTGVWAATHTCVCRDRRTLNSRGSAETRVFTGIPKKNKTKKTPLIFGGVFVVCTDDAVNTPYGFFSSLPCVTCFCSLWVVASISRQVWFVISLTFVLYYIVYMCSTDDV